MQRNANGDDSGPTDVNAYWRRRFLTLTVGLCVLGLLAWALSGGGNPGTAGTGITGSRQADVTAGGGGLTGPPGTAPASPASSPSAPGRAGGKAAAKRPPKGPTRRPAAHPARRTRRRRDALAAVPAPCPAAGVVLSLFTSKASYGPRERPRFDVYAVSTAPKRCAFRFGPRSVRVLVSSGRKVVWDSAWCAPAAPRTVWLARGVPAVTSVSWNRQVAGRQECAGLRAAGASGRFSAAASSRTQTSPPRYFDLLR